MAKTSGELEKEFIDNAKTNTGKSLAEWLKTVKDSRIEKRNEIMDLLKKEYNLNHMQAQFVTGIYLNNGQPVYIDEGNLLENQFAKCADMRPLFNELQQKILGQIKDSQLIPKKTYLSFTAVREFAAMNIKPKEIRLGLDLGDMPFTESVQKSKLTGPMPRISHMIIITGIKDFDKNVTTLIEQSYNRSHKK